MMDNTAFRVTRPSRRLRLDTLVRLRWLAVAGQTAALLIVHIGLDYPLPVGLAFSLVALSAWINVFLKIRSPAAVRVSEKAAALQLAYDILQLSGLLYLTGGLGNPFAFLLLAPVMVSATALSAWYTLALGALATFAASFLTVSHFPLPWPGEVGFSQPPVYVIGVWLALVLTLGFMSTYAFKVADEGRKLADALAATELVLQNEQHLNALDGLATAAAHELGTPLATILLAAKEMTDEFEDGDHRKDDILLIRQQAERCKAILRRLTSLSSDEDSTYQRMSVSQLMEEVADPHRGFGVEIVVEGAGDGPEPVGTRNAAIRYGLGNLLENAVDFANDKAEILAQWDARTLTITIRDDGPGFTPDLLARIGDPYVTRRGRNRETGGGLGLGFFIAKTLLERTGAKLFIENRSPPATGASIRVTWPRATIEAKEQVDAYGFSGHKQPQDLDNPT
ncbi:ActS/PrrB/RegB family redox-sensitive histidine kinase [Roseibium aestuarii]|uniref:histidine kinase n=1 Tax=Roseibium aestuarii TaxID=2600299 RepID=A0ABW4K3C9_9HYPH|nr:ActS/PrrB/RegB family redox-sensitive histidine kinase [Roseibium aestuarii]